MKTLLPPTYILLLALAATACEKARSEASRQPEHVDSIVPREEALRRFQAGLSQPTNLSNAAPSRDSLVRLIVTALEKRDTAALAALTLDRAEFAFLFYPTSAQSLPPYDLSPGLMWFMMQEGSRKGLFHALEERAGQPLKVLGYRCEGEPIKEGDNTIWSACGLRRLRAKGDTVEERLFGPIIARHGRFKLVSFANKL